MLLPFLQASILLQINEALSCQPQSNLIIYLVTGVVIRPASHGYLQTYVTLPRKPQINLTV